MNGAANKNSKYNHPEPDDGIAGYIIKHMVSIVYACLDFGQ